MTSFILGYAKSMKYLDFAPISILSIQTYRTFMPGTLQVLEVNWESGKAN